MALNDLQVERTTCETGCGALELMLRKEGRQKWYREEKGKLSDSYSLWMQKSNLFNTVFQNMQVTNIALFFILKKSQFQHLEEAGWTLRKMRANMTIPLSFLRQWLQLFRKGRILKLTFLQQQALVCICPPGNFDENLPRGSTVDDWPKKRSCIWPWSK